MFKLFSHKKTKNRDIRPINRVYHAGTKLKHQKINLGVCKNGSDFGSGFYAAMDYQNAERIRLRVKDGKGVISTFDFYYQKAIDDGLKILLFKEPNKEWMDFITYNRLMLGTHDYDIVIGPSADHNPFMDCLFYHRGDISYEEAIERINPHRFGEQILFHTERACEYLREIDE